MREIFRILYTGYLLSIVWIKQEIERERDRENKRERKSEREREKK